MSGILDRKQRIMDFSLTREGYKQIQNGDIRIKYASFSDKFAIYDTLEDTINIADENAMPFSFETFDNDFDVINHEVDINTNLIENSNINNNIKFITDYQSNFINVNNGYVTFENQNTYQNEVIFQELSNTTLNSIKNASLLLSDDLFNFNPLTGDNDDISLKLKKVNDVLLTNDHDFSNSFSLNTLNNNLNTNFINNNYSTCLSTLIIDDKSLFEDSRFINKLPYLFLPPSNMNSNTITKNNNIINSYTHSNDRRQKSKVIYKGFKNVQDLEIRRINLNDLSNNEILNSVKNLEIMSKEKIEKYITDLTLNTTTEFLNNQRILSFELEFSKIEVNSPFLIQLYETEIDSNNQLKFNKLLVIDHGEVFDSTQQKNIQVYSLGKLYHSKLDIDIKNERADRVVEKYIEKDNYLFVNLFTIIAE